MFLITRRSKIWVINCRRDDLMKKDANYLYNQCRMCDEHFDASQFMDPASKPCMGCYTNDISRSRPETSANTKEEGTNTPCPTCTGPSVVVTIRCQLRINVIRHGTVHRKMEPEG